MSFVELFLVLASAPYFFWFFACDENPILDHACQRDSFEKGTLGLPPAPSALAPQEPSRACGIQKPNKISTQLRRPKAPYALRGRSKRHP